MPVTVSIAAVRRNWPVWDGKDHSSAVISKLNDARLILFLSRQHVRRVDLKLKGGFSVRVLLNAGAGC
jgi:hypothetical protein